MISIGSYDKFLAVVPIFSDVFWAHFGIYLRVIFVRNSLKFFFFLFWMLGFFPLFFFIE